MTIFSLFPAYVVINYECSDASPSKMIRPTRPWIGTPFAGAGGYTAWDGSTVSAAIMIDDFVDTLLTQVTNKTTFTNYEIYTMSAPLADPILVWADEFSGKVGTASDTNGHKAWQVTGSMLSAGNTIAKLVILNCAGSITASKSRTWSVAQQAIFDELSGDSNAWAARNDEQIVAKRTISTTINRALKRALRI